MRFTLLCFTCLLWLGIDASPVLENPAIIAKLKKADQFRAVEDYPKAFQLYQEILPYFDDQKDEYHAAYVRLWMGECIYYEGRYQEALALSLRADDIVQEHFNTDTLNYYAVLLQNIGVFYSALGAFDNQMRYYQKLHQHALKFYGTNSRQAADAYFSLGAAFGRQGQWDKSLNYVDTSLQISKTLNYKGGIASAYLNLAHIYSVKEDYFKAIEYQKEALTITSSKEEKARGYNNLGMLFMDIEQYELAESNLQKALKLRRSIYPPYHDNITSTLINLCRIHFEGGAIQKANAYLDQAIANLEKAEEENKGYMKMAYNYKSAILLQQGHPKKSEAFACKALKIDGRQNQLDANSCMALANALLAQRKYQEALSQIQMAIDEIRNPQNGKLENISLSLDFLEVKTRILFQKGKKEIDKKALNMALETVMQADTLILQARNTYQHRASKKILAKNAHGFYATAIAITYELYDRFGEERYLEMAFVFAEKNKSMLVSEKLNDLYAKSFAGIPKSLLIEEQNLLQQIEFYSNLLVEARAAQNGNDIARWEPILFEKRRIQEDFLLKIERQYPRYFELKYQMKIPLPGVFTSKLLDPNEILIEYFLAQDVLYVILLSAERNTFHRLPVGADFIAQVNRLRQAIYQQDFTYTKLAYNIYAKILQPLEGQLKGSDLLIVPDGVMGLLPFEALLTKPIELADDHNFKSLPYLLKRHKVRYYFSASVALKDLEYVRNGNKRKGILAFAPMLAKMEGKESMQASQLRRFYNHLDPLEGAADEVNFLKEKYVGKFLLGQEASEAIFKKIGPTFQVLHIASHTIIDNQVPTASKLLLSSMPKSKEDGLLNIFELYNMELFADLTVLSACNTGTGPVVKGDGVVSLARAFAYAGCPNLVMSLWKVKDKTTPKLMAAYYQNLEKGLDKSEALHAAKLVYIDQSHSLIAHPYHWSGFIYVGDRDHLDLKTKDGNLYWYLMSLAFLAIFLFVSLKFTQ